MKVYTIKFMSYTNSMQNTVYSDKYNKYLVTGKSFVAQESDLEYLKDFGNGFKELMFVGELFIKD